MKRFFSQAGLYLLVAVIIFYAVFPFYYAIVSSLKSPAALFRGRGTLLLMILGVSMFPQVAVLSGMFELVRAFGLYNNLFSLTLSYMTFTIPFTVWVLTTFMRGLPKELEEAAIMDGANPWTIITRVFMPLLWP